MSRFKNVAAITLLSLVAAPALALEFDQNVTPAYINGTGTLNGSFTVDREGGVELGLRAKVRYNAMNLAENTFLSNGNGTYGPFAVGGPTAPASAVTRARWNFEWTINTDYDGTSGLKLSDLTYQLSMDGDPSCAVDAMVWDPVTPHANPAPLDFGCYDHSMGSNATLMGPGVVVSCAAAGSDVLYATNLDTYNVLQQSWNYRFYPPDGFFDQNVDGTYDISLTAFDAAGNVVASTAIRVIVGTGGDADADGDGICDSLDTCATSTASTTVVVDGCDTGVANTANADGCTIADQLADCEADAGNHGEWTSCVSHLTNALKADGRIDGREKGIIQRCAAQADVP